MSTATAMVGVSLAVVSLVITLMMAAAARSAWRKRVLRQRAETPKDQYRSAIQDLHRMRDDIVRDSERKSKRQSAPKGSSGA
jgi:hypothetical protein